MNSTLTSRDIAAMTAHAAAIKAENDARTQGRLQAVQYYSDAVSILDVDGFAIFDAPSVVILEGYHDKLGISHWAGDSRAHRDLGEAGQAANARRLVACWNACEGVPTETLELAASWGDIVKGVMGGARISAEAAAVGAGLDSESLEQGEVL